MTPIRHLLILLIILPSFLIPLSVHADELSEVIDHADTIFIKPNGGTYSQMASQRTTQLAMIFGFVVRTQLKYVSENPSLAKKFDHLKGLVHEYLGQVAANAQVKSDFDDSPITKEKLWKICTASIETTGNDPFCKMMFRVDPVLLQLPNFLTNDPFELKGGFPTGHDIFPNGLQKVSEPNQGSGQKTD